LISIFAQSISGQLKSPAIMTCLGFLPKNFKIYRNDTGTLGVGVFVGIHEDLISTENTSIITECETEWSKVKLKNNKDLHITSFYM
jgi:hypothetical protein